jgi:tripartite-type tricarboxylate transporter receptor subunit TctC
MSLTRRALVGVALSPLAAPAVHARISDRTIRVIVPFTAGSGPDLLARLAADELRQRWNQTTIVDNRPGASGNIGALAAARSAPDGHTLLLYVNTVLMTAPLTRDLQYDPIRSFEPIALIARGSLALSVHSSVEVNDAGSLVRTSIARPNDIRYASPGRGTPHHLAMELFKLRTGARMDHVPYNGTAGAVNDLIGGHVQSMFIPIHVGLQHAQSGRIRLLGVGSGQRTSLAPNVPTLAEQGIRDAEVDLWYGLAAPAGTPSDLIRQFNAAMNEMLADQRVRGLLQTQGLDGAGGTPGDLAALVAADAPRWAQVIQSAGITAEN